MACTTDHQPEDVNGQLRFVWSLTYVTLAGSARTLLRILNPSEKGAETSSSQAPTARRFYFTELAVPLVYIFVSSHVLANVANAAPSQATVEIHHAALSSLPQPRGLRVFDNETRWNSANKSISKAIQLQAKVSVFSETHRNEMSWFYLLPEDSDALKGLAQNLEVFWTQSRRLHDKAKLGHHGTIWEALCYGTFLGIKRN